MLTDESSLRSARQPAGGGAAVSNQVASLLAAAGGPNWNSAEEYANGRKGFAVRTAGSTEAPSLGLGCGLRGAGSSLYAHWRRTAAAEGPVDRIGKHAFAGSDRQAAAAGWATFGFGYLVQTAADCFVGDFLAASGIIA